MLLRSHPIVSSGDFCRYIGLMPTKKVTVTRTAGHSFQLSQFLYILIFSHSFHKKEVQIFKNFNNVSTKIQEYMLLPGILSQNLKYTYILMK